MSVLFWVAAGIAYVLLLAVLLRLFQLAGREDEQ